MYQFFAGRTWAPIAMKEKGKQDPERAEEKAHAETYSSTIAPPANGCGSQGAEKPEKEPAHIVTLQRPPPRTYRLFSTLRSVGRIPCTSGQESKKRDHA